MSKETRPILAVFLGLVGIGLFLVSPTVAALLSPAMLVALILSAGLFPGEELIDRVRRAGYSGRRRGRAPRVEIPASAAWVKPVGLALAFALANRPPPASRFAS